MQCADARIAVRNRKINIPQAAEAAEEPPLSGQ